MKFAKYTTSITVTDPDSKAPVELSVFKHENGGMFAIDSSYLDQSFDDDIDPEIPDPFFIVYDDDDDLGVMLTGL
jgi:hypothetical protein